MNNHQPITPIPKGLRYWFIAHFVLDMMFAVPLLFFPAWLLGVLGFETANLLLARLVGAALVGIGGSSLIMHQKDRSAYLPMLQLKRLWSGSAILAIALSWNETTASTQWFLLATFVFFFLLWDYYFKRLGSDPANP